MIEQIALAHHKIGELYYRARRVNSPEKVKVYNAAIAALLGEFRRMALALKSLPGTNAGKARHRRPPAESGSKPAGRLRRRRDAARSPSRQQPAAKPAAHQTSK